MDVLKPLKYLKTKLQLGAVYSFCIGRSPDSRHAAKQADNNEVFESISSWISLNSFDSLGSAEKINAKRAVLDAVVGILLGAISKEGRAILDFSSSTTATGKCVMPLVDSKLSCAMAAYAGTALCQVHDINDGHPTAGEKGGSHHPGRVVVPVALAVAQEVGMTGEQFLAAVAIGYDVALGVGYGPLGAPSDAYGAAAITCLGFGLSEVETAFALRIAGFSASRSGGEDFETNNLTCAQQARGGVEAAKLVCAGYPISKELTPGHGPFEFRLPARAGESLSELYFKPFPSCRYTHFFIEGALALRPKLLDKLSSIKQINIALPADWFGVAHHVGAENYYKCYQFSASYCVAATLVDGEFGLAQIEPARTGDESIQSLQEKIIFSEYVLKAPAEQSANNMLGKFIGGGTLKVELNNGTNYSYAITTARGSEENPLSSRELVDRLVAWTDVSLDDATGLLDIVMSLDAQNDINGLMTYMELLGNKLRI